MTNSISQRVAALLIPLAASIAHAAPGDLDNSFGNGGVTFMTGGSQQKDSTGIAIQSDGKVFMSFGATGFNAPAGGIVRLNSNLTLDGTWNPVNEGYLSTERPVALTLAPGTQTPVVATFGSYALDSVQGIQYRDIRLTRITATGVDTTFGPAGDGATPSFNSTTAGNTSGEQRFYAVAATPSGKYLAVGQSIAADNTATILVARFTSNGALDSTYGPGGRGWNTFQPDVATNTIAYAVVVQADDSAYIAGVFGNPTNGYVARVTADGMALDTAFSAGAATISDPPNAVVCNALRLLGTRVFVGCTDNGNFVVLAYQPNGTPDTTFATTQLDVGGPNDQLLGIEVLADGRVFATGIGGGTDNQMVIAAFAASGGKDATFGTNGVLTFSGSPTTGQQIAFDGSNLIVTGNLYNPATMLLAWKYSTSGTLTAEAQFDNNVSSSLDYTMVRLDSSGRANVAGTVGDLSTGSFVTARYAGDVFDSSYGNAGLSKIAIPGMSQLIGARAFALQPDGNAVVGGDFGGFAINALRIGAARLLASSPGGGDPAFNAGGTPGYNYVAQGAGGGFTRAIVLQSDGKILAAGTLNPGIRQMAVVRFNTDGTLDTSYGSGGEALSNFANATLGRNMALDSAGRAVVVGNQAGGGEVRIARFTTSGALDTSFGSGGMAAATPPSGYTLQTPSKILVLPNGKLVVAMSLATEVGASIGVMRFTATGTLDPTFGVNGFAAKSYNSPNGVVAFDALATPSGKILVGGTFGDAVENTTALLRFNANGAIDPSFGSGGTIVYTSSYAEISMVGITEAGDGSVYIAGAAYHQAFHDGFLLKTVADPSAVAKLEHDFDADAKSDLLWRNSTDGSVQAWLMNGLTATNTATLTSGGYTFTHVADLNGDGKSDLLIRSDSDGSILALMMNGLGVTSINTLAPGGTGYSVVATGDLNGDGKADIILQHTDGTVLAWLMDGPTVTATATFVGAGSGWNVSKVADLNGDGKADIIWQNTNGAVQAWLMDGLSVTSIASFTPPGSGWSVVLAVDLDGDGNADLFWQHTDGTTQAWLMNGLTATGLASFTPAGTGWSPVLAGDINGDGKADIFWQHTSGASQTWLMNGLTATGVASFVPAGTGWTASHLLDLNGDGNKDVFWKHTNGAVQAWLMNGLTINAIASLAPPGPYSVVP